LARDLGVPVVPTAARQREGLDRLLQAVNDVATGAVVCRPHRIQSALPAIKQAVIELTEKIQQAYPELPNARWVALRLLDGDRNIIQAIQEGELGTLSRQDPASEGQALDRQLEITS
jgi:ferrous iron transport protein B